jgi:hypothetical protein
MLADCFREEPTRGASTASLSGISKWMSWQFQTESLRYSKVTRYPGFVFTRQESRQAADTAAVPTSAGTAEDDGEPVVGVCLLPESDAVNTSEEGIFAKP